MTRPACAIGVASMALVVVAPARADEPMAAETLFNRGVEAMKRSDFETGCPLVAESERLEPRAGTLFTLAECWHGAGRSATALARYHEYLRVFERMSASEQTGQRGREEVARARVRELEATVPTITLQAPERWPDSVVVKRNGHVVGQASFGLAVPTDPGEQVIEVIPTRGEPKRITLQLTPGQKATVVLRPPEHEPPSPAPVAAPDPAPIAASAEPSPPRADHAPSPLAIAGWSAVGLSGAGLIVGAVTGGVAMTRADTIDRECGIGGDPNLCTARGADLTSSTRALAHTSTAAFVVAGLSAAVGLTLLLVDGTATEAGALDATSDGVIIRF